MTSRGFTVLELLVAMVITLLVVAAAVTLAAAARTSFLVEPAALDTVRRLREGADILGAALAGAGGDHAVGDGVWTLRSSVPPVRPLTALDESPGDRFTAVWVLRAVAGGLGQVGLPQDGPSGS
jgi:prepilin-type N-terminal cleavage/methylation domain-containing protein